MNEQEVRQLKADLDAEHEADLAAIDRVLALFARRAKSAQGTLFPSSAQVAESHNQNGAGPIPRADASSDSLIEIVRAILKTDPTKVWTVTSLKKEMEAACFKFAAKNAHASLAKALRALHGRQQARLVRRGKGNRPNEYRAALPSSAEADGRMDAVE